ncbi:MAG: ATP-dependent helicase RecG [Blastocatellia bacterium]|nr:ATP-dependent helicase RecG [Blastocatellia bacterium]
MVSQLSLAFPSHYALLSPDEIYETVDENLLKQLAEDRRLERKPAGMHGKDLGRWFSMWANTAPEGGLIIVGMEDEGEFSGCHSLSSDRLNKLEKSHYTYVPDARVDSKRIAVTALDGSDSFVVVFRVRYREDKVVQTVSGPSFIRRGDECRELKRDEIRELEIDKRQVDIEKEPVTLVYPDDFDADLIRRFIEGVKKVHQPLQNYDDITVLEQRRLGRISSGLFTPNTACALAFAKDPGQLFPGCQIMFLRVDGEVEKSGDQYNVIKRIPIEGPVPRLLEQAATMLGQQLRDFSRLGDDGIFYSAPEYPYAAWYEALVNACVHRSYGLKTMNVFVKMFDDKLVIESPGGFPPTVTPDNIYVSHVPRNPTLMRAMFYLGLVKEHAEGTKRMRETMQNMNLPDPQFRQTETGIGFSQVWVTLKNHIKQRKVWIDSDVTIALGDALAKNLKPEEKRVLNFVAEHGKINVIQCHRLLPSLAKWHSAKRLLMRLVEKGLLIHVSRGKRDNKAHFVLPPAFKGAKNGN